MTEKKAVLNVTVDESLAEQVRETAKFEHTTISSVVERALRQQLAWELKRIDGIRAIEEYYDQHGWPTAEEMAEAEAQVAEEHRLIDEARALMAARDHAAQADGGDIA
jgi:predicted transcriptional regulator